MALPKGIDIQRDFTAGEIDPTAKRRDDDEFVKRGMRQLSNARLLNTGAVTQRPGRNALQAFTVQARVEEVLMAPGVKYRFSFTNAHLTIYDTAGAQVFTEAGRAWTGATLGQIIYAVYLKQVVITFPGVIPETLTWDGSNSWASASFAELSLGTQKRTPFYRLSPQGVTMALNGLTGAGVTATFSAGMNLVAGHVGTRMRYLDRQLLITAVASAISATVTVEEPVPPAVAIITNNVVDVTTVLKIGDEVVGSISGCKGIVTQLGSPNSVQVQLLGNTIGFSSGTDHLVGPAGDAGIINSFSFGTNAAAIVVWDDEVMNAFRGWPRSVTSDQGRLILSDFPGLPNGIAWSANGSPTDLYVGPNPIDGFFEIAPGKNRVQHVVAGPEGSEIVFCDAGIFYIPISATNPLKPGSVAFIKISSDGAGLVQPRSVGNVVLFVDQGLIQVQSIIATGAYYRPFEVENLTDLHSHLFNNIHAIALPTSVTQFAERYAYVLNGDGTVAVGKYALDKDNKIGGKIGWLPWNGSWACKWVSALNDVVLFVDAYTVGGTTAYMLDQLDAALYLDTSLPVNAIPTALTPPGGKGPLWWLPGATVDLMDGALPLGPHATDANGFLVPNTPGEDLTSATLRAGFTWTGIWEPFVLASTGAQDTEARMKKRSIARFETYVSNSTGFRFAKFYSGKLGPLLPALGDIVSDRRIPMYNQGDDAALPPPLRDEAYAYKPRGRSHDPRAGIIKDTPGPITLVEMAAKAST